MMIWANILLKMRRRIDDELKRDRTFEDLRFLKDYDDLDEKRKNISNNAANSFFLSLFMSQN